MATLRFANKQTGNGRKQRTINMPPPTALSIDELVGAPDRCADKQFLGQSSNVSGDKGKMRPLIAKKSDPNVEAAFKLPERYKYIRLLGHGAYGLVW